MTAVWTEPAAGDDAMQVWMKQQVLPPGVQDGSDPKLRSQPFAVGGEREQRLRSCLKEQVVQPTGMVQHQGVQRHRQGEHHVEVLHGQ